MVNKTPNDKSSSYNLLYKLLEKMKHFKHLDTVALLINKPSLKLASGQVGAVVEQLDENVYEIEFTDTKGRTLISCPIEAKFLMLLHFESVV